MRSKITAVAVLSALLGVPAAFAGERPIDIHTDLEGRYYLVETSGSPELPTLVVKRAAPGYNHYVKREIDCAANTVRYLGEGETLDEMNEAEPDADVYPIEKGSIADQLSRIVCPKKPD